MHVPINKMPILQGAYIHSCIDYGLELVLLLCVLNCLVLKGTCSFLTSSDHQDLPY